MKKSFLSLLFFSLAHFISAQANLNKLSVSGGFGLQHYAGDLGNGLYQIKGTKYGVATLSLDYTISPSFALKLMGTLGDLGLHKSKKDNPETIGHLDHHSHHHEAGNTDAHGVNAETENLNSRMGAVVLAVQYNFSNGHILNTESKFSPYIYGGMGINRLTDIMEMGCVLPGVYYSINIGTGLRYKICDQVSIGYQLSFGMFTSDKLDFFDRGHNDIYMQNSAMLGYSF